ncbi:uncharacterized protein LOC125658102 [Ostrea edulis]|uniref:uncharacterized protein LOC125658102 n=1 Tax=Ostrea edulis TaxID=37623 RepID=UPI0024AF9C58|nr:uncharacterized protein LOC125658102 [Ostrea edulis]
MECRYIVTHFLMWIGTLYVAISQVTNTSLASLSQDELANGLRFQELQFSTTKINASLHANLPEKLAAAEAQEADEREAKAFRAFQESQTPFIATTSRYNLGYIGRGYDLYKGNPLSEEGVVDQGFRLPIIDLPYTHKFTADGEYRVPDNVDVIAESSAKFGSSLYSVQSESDYKSMLSVDASVNAGGGGWGLSASFSASASYQKNTQEIQKGETTTLSIVSRAVVYRARMSETSKMSKVTDYFEKAVMLLPMEDCEEDSLQEMYLNFIQEFGTHYTTQVVMGAKAVQQLTFSKSDLSKMESEGISATVAAQVAYSGFGVSADGGFSVGTASEEESKQRVQNTNKEQYEYYIGGNPPAADFSSGSTESLREWARSAYEKPVPIQYRLTSIDTLIKPGYFRGITYGLFDRRRCMRKALYSYCKQTVSPSLCNPPDESSRNLGSRRKRQTSDIPSAIDSIKFGDFVTLKNRKSKIYLALSSSTGHLKGIVTKPLVPVDSIQNYDGLFQIKSSDNDPTILGTPLVYGQSFKLVPVDGDNMFTGRLFIDDVSNAAESKLQTAFDGHDGRKFSAPGDVTDFSVFLKMDKYRSYLISLQMNCNGRDSLQYQVNLEGPEGTVKFQMTKICHSMRVAWYHGAFADKDIGQLQRVRFMGVSGTEPIKGIQIRTGQGRQILKYRKENLICVGNEVSFTMSAPESKRVDIDIYPAQFSFHSKNYPAGSVVRQRDTVFVEVVSAVDRKSFWGQPVSHLLSNKNQVVTILETGPVAHKAKKDCNEIIFPDDNRVGVGNSLDNRYFVSFAVDIMIKNISIGTKKGFSAANFTVEYINRNNTSFQQLQNIIRDPTTGTIKKMVITLPKMYLSAIKVYVDGVNDFAENVQYFFVTGCLGALVEEKPQDTAAEEWDLRLSENQIQAYPYLRIVTTQHNESTFDRIFDELEKPIPIDNYRKDVPLEPSQRGCTVNEEYIHNYLMTTDEIEGLKFQNTRVYTTMNTITITTSVMAMNRIMYERNMPALDSLLRMAIQRYPCNSRQLAFVAYPQSSAEGSGISPTAIAVITVFGILVAVALVCATIFATIRLKQGKKDKILDVDPMVEQNVYQDDGKHEEQLYTNRAYEVSPIVPSRQRRLT